MVILRQRISKVNFVAVFTLSTLIFIIGTTKAIPTTNSTSSKPVSIGIRVVASPVDKFCREFGRTLADKQGLGVVYPGVVNQYINRYEGLQEGGINIECGPNSRTSRDLLDKDNRKFLKTIDFSSRAFHKTGTRLLLKRDIAKRLKDLNTEELKRQLKTINIVVAKNTTTENQLLNNQFYPNVYTVEKANNLNARVRALKALETGRLDDGTRVDAFASDAVIVQALLEEGVKQEGKQGEPYFQEVRSAYKDEGFVIFPSKYFPFLDDAKNYLPALNEEEYVIAVSKQNSGKWLDFIDNTLADLKAPNSPLAKASTAIGQFEKGEIPQPTPKPTDSSQITPLPKPNPWLHWLEKNSGLIGALATIIAAIITAILNPQLVSLFFKSIGGFITPGRRQSSTSNSRKLRGRVLDDVTNIGIQGAQIRLDTEGFTSRTTDAEGNFIFPVQSSENEIRVYVNANSYRQYDKFVTFSQDTEALNIEIKLSR
jgi:ABC-type amino acid transport substrate-binding protein